MMAAATVTHAGVKQYSVDPLLGADSVHIYSVTWSKAAGQRDEQIEKVKKRLELMDEDQVRTVLYVVLNLTSFSSLMSF